MASPAPADFEQRASRILKQENFRSFKDFYPFYLSQHSNRTCRRLHNIGSLIGIVLLLNFIARPSFSRLLYPFLAGYGFAWVRSLDQRVSPPVAYRS